MPTKERYRKLRARGICTNCCSKKALPEKMWCQWCLDEREWERVIIRANPKQCYDCYRPNASGKSRCEKCMKLHLKRTHKLKKRYRQEGRCPGCGRVLTEMDKGVCCSICKDKFWRGVPGWS